VEILEMQAPQRKTHDRESLPCRQKLPVGAVLNGCNHEPGFRRATTPPHRASGRPPRRPGAPNGTSRPDRPYGKPRPDAPGAPRPTGPMASLVRTPPRAKDGQALGRPRQDAPRDQAGQALWQTPAGRPRRDQSGQTLSQTRT
jgi:hypothetical protein